MADFAVQNGDIGFPSITLDDAATSQTAAARARTEFESVTLEQR